MSQREKEIMHKLWDRAHRYQNLIDWANKHLRRFGLKRYVFFIRFSKIERRLDRYRAMRFLYVSMALGISRKLNTVKRIRRRMDH